MDLEVYAEMLRWSFNEDTPYMHAEAQVYVQMELTRDVWEALKAQMGESEAMEEFGLAEEDARGEGGVDPDQTVSHASRKRKDPKEEAYAGYPDSPAGQRRRTGGCETEGDPA